MEVTDAETEAGVGLEPAVGSDHVDAGGLEGELSREDELAMVDATFKGHSKHLLFMGENT